MEAPSSLSTPKRKRPLPFEPIIPNLNQTRALTGLTGEFTFELGLSTDTEDGSKSPRTTVAHRLQHLFLNGGALGGTSTGGVFGGGIAPARTSTLTPSQPSRSRPQQPLSQTHQQDFGYPFPQMSRSQDMQEAEEDNERPGGPRKRAKLHDRDIDMTGSAETPMRPPASTNNGGTFEAAGATSSSSMPPPSTPVSQQAGAVITPGGPVPKRRLAPKGVRFNMDPAVNQQAELSDNTMRTSGTTIIQTTKNNGTQIPSSSPLSSITQAVANPNSTPTQRPLAPKPANISMAPPSSSSAAAATKKPRKSKSPPLQPQPAASTSTASPNSHTIIDPIRASLTWQDSEITVYDPDDSDDDGTGINGIGFKPTPEMEHARRMKRKKQLAEYRKREMGEARARRKERRAGADGLVGSGNEGGGGSNGAPKGKDAMATAKGKLKAEKRRVRFLETVTKTVVEMPPPPPVTMMEGVMQMETAAAAEGQGPSGGADSRGGDASVSGMAGAGADLARAET